MGKKKKTDESQRLEYAAFWERIDNLGVKIGALDPEKDEAVLLKLRGEVFDLLYRQFGGGEIYDEAHPNRTEKELDALGEFFLKDWAKFDGSKGTLSYFIQSRLERRGVDMYRKDFGVHSKTIRSENTENTETENDRNAQRERVRIANGSLDAPVGNDEDGEGLTIGNTIVDSGESPEVGALAKASTMEFFTLVMSFENSLKGHEHNQSRIDYYRMFFTDSAVSTIREIERPWRYIRHEQEFFVAVKLSFLDYFMSAKCRTIPSLVYTALRPYGELAEGHESETKEVKQPFPYIVYMTYMKRVENRTVAEPTLSGHYTRWKELVCNVLNSADKARPQK